MVAQGNIGSNVSSVESKRMQSLIRNLSLSLMARITDECHNPSPLKEEVLTH
jgi:hypothetical protein